MPVDFVDPQVLGSLSHLNKENPAVRTRKTLKPKGIYDKPQLSSATVTFPFATLFGQDWYSKRMPTLFV